MKRKRTPAPEPEPLVIPEALLEEAKRSIESDRLPKTVVCTVCSSECAPNSAEGLCWVCRRLRISAWLEIEQQMPVQE